MQQPLAKPRGLQALRLQREIHALRPDCPAAAERMAGDAIAACDADELLAVRDERRIERWLLVVKWLRVSALELLRDSLRKLRRQLGHASLHVATNAILAL